MPIKEVSVKLTAKQLLFSMISDNEMKDYKEVVEDAHNKYNLLNDKNKTGTTPLMHALKSRNFQAVQILLETKADPNVSCSDITPLHYALLDNNNAAVKLLLDNKADVNHQCNGKWPLEIAVTHLDPIATSYLLQAKADANIKPNAGELTLLQQLCFVKRMIAHRDNFFETAKQLLAVKEAATISTNKGATLLHLAIKNNNIMINPLLETKANCDAQDNAGDTPLHLAIKLLDYRFDNGIVKKLLEYTSDLNVKNADGKSPLMLAVEDRNTDCALALINAKASLCKNFDRLLIDAIKNDNVHHFNQLIALKANPNISENGSTALSHSIATRNYYSSTKYATAYITKLLEEKADPNLKNLDGSTPIIRAIKENNLEVLNLLITAKADIHSYDQSNGEPPLLVAIKNEFTDLELVKALLAAKADPNSKVKGSLMIEVCQDTSIFKALFEAKANIHMKNDAGNTALHTHAQHYQLNMVKTLLDYKADPSMQNKEGMTALSLARSHPYNIIMDGKQTVQLLESVTPGLFSRFCDFWKKPTSSSHHTSEQVKEAKAKPY